MSLPGPTHRLASWNSYYRPLLLISLFVSLRAASHRTELLYREKGEGKRTEEVLGEGENGREG